MNDFTVYEGPAAVAQVHAPADVSLSVQERPQSPPASRLPVDPLPIPPPGFIVISEGEAALFGLTR